MIINGKTLHQFQELILDGPTEDRKAYFDMITTRLLALEREIEHWETRVLELKAEVLTETVATRRAHTRGVIRGFNAAREVFNKCEPECERLPATLGMRYDTAQEFLKEFQK